MSATDLVSLVTSAALVLLDGRAMTKDELGRMLGEVRTDQLPKGADRHVWRSASWYAANQYLGESLVLRFALPVLSLHRVLCHGGRQGRSPLLRRVDQWVTGLRSTADSIGLVRRYPRCYGRPTRPASPPGAVSLWRTLSVCSPGAISLRPKRPVDPRR